MSLYCEALTALVLTTLFIYALASYGIYAIIAPFALLMNVVYFLAMFVPIFIIVFLVASLGELALKAIFRSERRVITELEKTVACKDE